MEPDTIKGYISELISQYKDKTALVYRTEFRRETYSYGELHSYAHKIARFFEINKIKKGDKVLIYSYNSPDWCAVFFACAITGVIAVPIDYNSKDEFAKEIYSKVKAKAIFYSKFKPISSKVKLKIKLNNKLKSYCLEDLKNTVKSLDLFYGPLITENDILEIVYTSGTTSSPKGVIITNKNIVANIRSLKNILPLKTEYCYLSVIPLSHLFEQTAGFFIPLRFGGKIIYVPSRKSRIILEAMKEENATVMISVPAILENIKDKIERNTDAQKLSNLRNLGLKFPISVRRMLFNRILCELGNIKYFPVGGAPISRDLEEFFDSIGILVLQGYGLTETSPVLTMNSTSNKKIGTVGKVLPNQEIKLIDGEIIAKGDNITSGYYENKKATNDAIRDGWFYTGDLGEFDFEGFLTIKGRKKNMLLTSSGLNIYPEDVEKEIKKVSAIKDSCVLALDVGKNSVITAVILLKDNYALSGIKSAEFEKDLLSKINANLATHQQVQKIIVWTEKDFPRTPSLKIKRNDLKLQLDKILQKPSKSKDLKSSSKVSNILDAQDKNYSLLCNLISDISSIDKNKILPNSILSTDLAIDSLSRIELVSLVEEEFGVEISEDKINEKTTVQDLENLLKTTQIIEKKTNNISVNISNIAKLFRVLIQKVMFLYLNRYYSVKVEGLENLNVAASNHSNSPVIFAANHSSHLDTPTIIRALPYEIRKKTVFAGAKDYFFQNKFKGFLAKLVFNAYPFSRDSEIRSSLKLTGTFVDKGYNIAIYPEGTRSTDKKIHSFKVGIGLIGGLMQIPVVPVKIEGAADVLPKGSSKINKIIVDGKKKEIVVKFGKPIVFNSNMSYLEITKQIENAVRKL